jgi:hypothetical protein
MLGRYRSSAERAAQLLAKVVAYCIWVPKAFALDDLDRA